MTLCIIIPKKARNNNKKRYLNPSQKNLSEYIFLHKKTNTQIILDIIYAFIFLSF